MLPFVCSSHKSTYLQALPFLSFNIGDITMKHEGGIYLMESNGFYKIGRATLPSQRLKSLQTGNPHEIKLIKTWHTNSFNGVCCDCIYESSLQALFSHKSVRGEWFALSSEDINLLMENNNLHTLLKELKAYE